MAYCYSPPNLIFGDYCRSIGTCRLLFFFSRKYVLALIFFVLLGTTPVVAQTTQETTSGSSTRKFSYVIQSTYGVNVSSTSTPGFRLEGEAKMGILPGSYVSNQSGSGGVSMSPTGITVSGIDAGLNLNLDPATTFFRAKLSSSSSSTEDVSSTSAQAVSGTASVSATGSATTSFSVESSDTLNESTFTQNF